MHSPIPPKGDQPETWKVNIQAFNLTFNDVLFEGYSKEQIHDWIKREMIDTATITDIERIGLADTDSQSGNRSKVETIKYLINDKLQHYQLQIENLEKVIKESEMQARLFDDQTQYNSERKRDIERYNILKTELQNLLDSEIIVQ